MVKHYLYMVVNRCLLLKTTNTDQQITTDFIQLIINYTFSKTQTIIRLLFNTTDLKQLTTNLK